MTLLKITAAVWFVSAVVGLAMIAFARRDPFDLPDDEGGFP